MFVEVLSFVSKIIENTAKTAKIPTALRIYLRDPDSLLHQVEGWDFKRKQIGDPKLMKRLYRGIANLVETAIDKMQASRA